MLAFNGLFLDISRVAEAPSYQGWRLLWNADSWGLAPLVTAGVAGVAVRSNQLRIPGYMQLSGEGVDVEGGSGGGAGQLRIVNGVIQRG